MKKAIILHCWFGSPKINWYQKVAEELTSLGYSVTIPELIDSAKPTLEDWKNSALKNFEFDTETVLVGHSLSCALALRLVEESNCKIKSLITVSGWDFWDLTPEHESFFSKRFNYNKIIANSEKRYVLHSDNDPYVTKFIAQEYAKRINAEFILVEGAGHFQTSDGVENLPNISRML